LLKIGEGRGIAHTTPILAQRTSTVGVSYFPPEIDTIRESGRKKLKSPKSKKKTEKKKGKGVTLEREKKKNRRDRLPADCGMRLLSTSREKAHSRPLEGVREREGRMGDKISPKKERR